jgi:dihydrofolate synthase/folylpolyglutamate synthase
MSLDPLEYLDSQKGAGIRPGLAPVRRLLKRLGDPQDRYRSLLVGGTNGKGSIASSLASILQAAGYRVGLYTSPHLVDVRERIRVDGSLISAGDLRSRVRQVRRAAREGVTYFEFVTAVAFHHFARCAVDVAILEVGMGGRLDATNVVRPELSIISNIALDHAEFLGPRLADIAREKAGIIRVRCLHTAARQATDLGVFEEACRRRGRAAEVGREIRVRSEADGSLACKGPGFRWKPSRSRCGGPTAETPRARSAVGSARRGFDIGDEASAGALPASPGRAGWRSCAEPPVLLDGPTTAGPRRLRRPWAGSRTADLTLGFSPTRTGGACSAPRPAADRVIATRPPEEGPCPRALAAEAGRWSRRVDIEEDPREAVGRALAEAGNSDLVCIAGSLYLVGAVRPLLISSKGNGLVGI